uniref:Translocon-associated protein subunit delta n=1 Tax=Megaselia scalaris TaxID=36166 RepID=T1H2G9_MEGSC
MFKFVVFAVLSVFAASAYGACTSPKASATSFTSSDATIVSQVATVVDLSFKCSNGETPQLYGEINGRVILASKISWNDEVKKAISGSVTIRLFDEEGYSNIRKAQREGVSLSSVKSISEVTVSVPSAYTGPLVNSELLVAFLAIFIGYFAFTTKSKLQA